MAVEVHAAATAAASVSDAHPDAVKFASVDLAADPFAVEYSSPPFVVEQRFVPAELLASDPAGWCGMLQALAPKLPVQLHCEPFLIGNVADEGCQPIFRRAVELLSGVSEVSDLMSPTLPSGGPRRARLKFRLATKGKFIHRNRYRRRQILCCLHGEQHWLFMSSYGGGADAFLGRTTNDNWNGFRSAVHPAMLTVEQMHELAAAAPAGVVARVVRFRAGDVMMFDGRWWHATSYTTPVLNLFFTPGDDMEVAVKEHKRRMAMPMQKDLKLCTLSMAKCSKLSSAWNIGADGKPIDWTSTDGHIELPTSGASGAGDDYASD